jgi:CARDB/Bacterial SH3 domain
MKNQFARILSAGLAAWLAIVACNIPLMSAPSATQQGPSQDQLALTAAALVLTAQAPAPTAETVAEATAETAATVCPPTVTANLNANVRSGPGTTYSAVGSLPRGTSANVAGKNDDATWWYIEFAAGVDGHAWIAASVTTSACIPADLAVISPSTAEGGAEAAAGDEQAAPAGGEVAAKPDLIITKFRINPQEPTSGVPATVEITTRNQGNAASGPYVVHWYGLSTYHNPSCTWDVGNSNPGGGQILNCEFAFPSPYATDMSSLAVIDATSQVDESEEGNNEATISPFRVNAP